MTYDESLRWLLTLPDFERTGEFSERPDVEPMRALLAALGNPHLGPPTAHIAGSKGKGSTGAMIEAIVRAAGRRTGFYISPHLHRYVERIRIDGKPAEPETFAAATKTAREAMDEVGPRFAGRRFLAFDALTAAAFVAFREAGCDAQVVEVGLGGTLDSTNVFEETDVAVITPISLEHTAVLGSTIPEIASQKAGIIKPGSTVVVAPQRESALDVIRAVASERGARVVEVAAACQMNRVSATLDHQEFKLKTSRATYAARLPLIGRHQLDNAATAIIAAEELADRAGFEITPDAVKRGLGELSWPARMEVLKRRPLVIVDGAHNGDSARRMVAAARDHAGARDVTFVLGTFAGKDVRAMAEAIAPAAREVFVPSWPHRRAMEPGEALDALREQGIPVRPAGSIDEAIEGAIAGAGEGGCVVAFGSLAFAAMVREYLLGIESDMIRLTLTKGDAPA